MSRRPRCESHAGGPFSSRLGMLGGALVTQEDAQRIAEAQLQFSRYLSDEIAPMIFADAAEVFFKAPPELMAREVHSWIGNQLQGPQPSPVSDYLLHSARKIYHLGDLELIPKDELKQFMDRLTPLLVGICPQADRTELAENFGRLGISETSGLASHISVSRSPSTGGGGGGGLPGAPDSRAGDSKAQPSGAHDVAGNGRQARPSEQIEAPPPVPPHGSLSDSGDSQTQSAATDGADQTTAHIDRLNLLLDRWERMASTPGTPSAKPLNSSLAGAESAILSRIIDEVATSARSSSDLNNQLRYLNDFGVESLGDGVLSALSGSLFQASVCSMSSCSRS